MKPRYTKDQLEDGIEVEKEHDVGPALQRKIAIDHLKECPEYYEFLEEMEKKMKKRKRRPVEVEKDDDDEDDEEDE